MKINFDILRMLLLGTFGIAPDNDTKYPDEQVIYHHLFLKRTGYLNDVGLTNSGLEAAYLMHDSSLWYATTQNIATSRFCYIPLSVVLEMLRQEMIRELRGVK